MSDMTRASLRGDLQSMLMSSAQHFDDQDLDRHLDVALDAARRVRPRMRDASITLQAGTSCYAAPADLVATWVSTWGMEYACRPWDAPRLPRPRLSSRVDANGSPQVCLLPAPTQAQIAAYGAEYAYTYVVGYTLSDSPGQSTVPASMRSALLIRACAQAMQELAMRGVTRPVELGRAGVGSMPKNGAPAQLAKDLLDLFAVMA